MFTSITTCRIVNTASKGGPLSSARNFYVSGSLHFADQGGNAAGCGIPASATAIAANVVVIGGTKAGYVKAYATGVPAPGASILNFGTTTVANSVPVAIRPGTAQGLTLSASSPVTVIVDITGYYAPQITAYIGSMGNLSIATGRVTASTLLSTGSYQITVDRNVFDCMASATPVEVGYYAIASTGTGGTVYVHTWTLSSTATPIAANEVFNLTVTC